MKYGLGDPVIYDGKACVVMNVELAPDRRRLLYHLHCDDGAGYHSIGENYLQKRLTDAEKLQQQIDHLSARIAQVERALRPKRKKMGTRK